MIALSKLADDFQIKHTLPKIPDSLSNELDNEDFEQQEMND